MDTRTVNPTADTELIENLVFDELFLGRSAQMTRTLTQDDIHAFAIVSGDLNPAHLDADYAAASRFRGVIAHGMWEGALISTMLGTLFPGPGTIYLEQTLHFSRPVRIGDCLTVHLSVAARDEASKHVTMDCTISNQRGEVTLTGQAVVLAPIEKISRPRPPLPRMELFDPHARLQQWMASLALDRDQPVRCVAVHPCDSESLRGALQAAEHGLVSLTIVAPRAKLQVVAEAAGLSLDGVAVIDVPHSHAAAECAAEMAVRGEAELLVKGSLHTDELMHAVISRPALRTERRISHVFRFDIPTYPKPLLITDAAINIAPSLEEKADIVRNAITVAHALGVPRPKIGILSAVETVTPKLVSTLDAAALCKMADRGQITGAVLDGPLAFDNAISAEAARIKHIESSVAGHVDVLVVPDLESGNMLAKQLEYLAGAASCGVVVGARVPIALTSRADGADSRLASVALGALLVQDARRARGAIRTPD